MAHSATRSAFEESTARLRLIASGRVRRETETLKHRSPANVQGVLPFTVHRTFADGVTAGKQGPAFFESESFQLARVCRRPAPPR